MMQVSSSGAMRPLGRLFGVLFGLGAVLMLLFAMPLAGRADAAKKPVTTKPRAVAGGSCSPLGAHAAGTSLDCSPNATMTRPYRPPKSFGR